MKILDWLEGEGGGLTVEIPFWQAVHCGKSDGSALAVQKLAFIRACSGLLKHGFSFHRNIANRMTVFLSRLMRAILF